MRSANEQFDRAVVTSDFDPRLGFVELIGRPVALRPTRPDLAESANAGANLWLGITRRQQLGHSQILRPIPAVAG